MTTGRINQVTTHERAALPPPREPPAPHGDGRSASLSHATGSLANPPLGKTPAPDARSWAPPHADARRRCRPAWASTTEHTTTHSAAGNGATSLTAEQMCGALPPPPLFSRERERGGRQTPTHKRRCAAAQRTGRARPPAQPRTAAGPRRHPDRNDGTDVSESEPAASQF